MTSYDRAAVAAIADQEIPVGAKGWPALATGMPASAVAAAGWRVLDRWRVIPTTDDDYRVVGALHTFF